MNLLIETLNKLFANSKPNFRKLECKTFFLFFEQQVSKNLLGLGQNFALTGFVLQRFNSTIFNIF